MLKLRNLNPEDIACLLAIIIGGVVTMLHPDKMGESFQYSVGAIVLIKIFW